MEVEVRAADEILRRHAIRFVVIGGQAIARQAATATHDVDVMVATEEFARTVERLRTDPELVFDWEDAQLARFRIRPEGGVPLDIINSAAFSGPRPGSEFFRYLQEVGSRENEGVAYAIPEVVWYTRLLTKRWRAYAEKIVTNIIDGVSTDHLARVDELAAQFGNEAALRERIAYVREELRRPEIAPLLRRGESSR